ncbi:MAG: hypothetical protein D6730_23330 [Bacteroidetes bacterium]|nr:MAG: hypothetical protein D6730_23330 [Bacteroidota bacterium]
MENVRIKALEPERVDKVKSTLTYQGKIAAIKLYMKYADCRLREAKIAVEKLGQEIEPGQAG